MSYIQSREAIEGVCRDKIACAAATPLPSVTGYPTSVKASSTPARAPSSCSCTDHPERGFKRRYSLSIETETECNSAKHISAHLIYVSEMSDSEDLSRNFAETDTETQVVLLPRNFDHIVAVQPRGTTTPVTTVLCHLGSLAHTVSPHAITACLHFKHRREHRLPWGYLLTAKHVVRV